MSLFAFGSEGPTGAELKDWGKFQMIDPSDVANRFDFHPATDEEKRNAHASIRQACRQAADFINEVAPDGREKSLAITALEEAMFWGNAALARK